MPRHSPCALFCLTFFSVIMWVLFLRSFFSLPQNCSISTQISEKLHLIFKILLCCLLCCFCASYFVLFSFQGTSSGFFKLQPFGVRLLPSSTPVMRINDWWAQMTFYYSDYRDFTLSYNRSSLFSSFLPSSLRMWWAQMDSNHRPRAYQARALTA